MSSSDDDGKDYRFYNVREDFADLTPIKQDGGPFPVVAIDYSIQFVDSYDYLRAIMKKNEMSERALEVTADCITRNPANYTVWHFRRVLLKALNKDLKEELKYITEIVEEEQKNYQVWFHRGIIVQWMNDCSMELDFTSQILQADGKNYHCWQHRQMVMNTFNLWGGEVEFTTVLLDRDTRNNSAWNQRFYAIKNTTGFNKETVECEIGFAVQAARKCPNNESAWNYLNGILNVTGGLHLYPGLKDDFEEWLAANTIEHDYDFPYICSFLIDFYEAFMEHNGINHDYVKRAVELCKKMAEEYDELRKNYWNYIKRTLQSKFPIPT